MCPDDGIDIVSVVVHSGFPRPLPGDQRLYEKTSVTTEAVRGKLLMKGTAAHQLKLCVGSIAATPLAIGLPQKFAPGEVDGKVDPDYIANTSPIRSMSIWSPANVWLILGPTETAVMGSRLTPSVTTAGELAVHVEDTNAFVVGVAMEAVTSGSAEHKQILVQLNPYYINVS